MGESTATAADGDGVDAAVGGRSARPTARESRRAGVRSAHRPRLQAGCRSSGSRLRRSPSGAWQATAGKPPSAGCGTRARRLAIAPPRKGLPWPTRMPPPRLSRSRAATGDGRDQRLGRSDAVRWNRSSLVEAGPRPPLRAGLGAPGSAPRDTAEHSRRPHPSSGPRPRPSGEDQGVATSCSWSTLGQHGPGHRRLRTNIETFIAR